MLVPLREASFLRVYTTQDKVTTWTSRGTEENQPNANVLELPQELHIIPVFNASDFSLFDGLDQETTSIDILFEKLPIAPQEIIADVLDVKEEKPRYNNGHRRF